MKKISGFLSLVFCIIFLLSCLLFSDQNANAASEYDSKIIKKIEKLINETYITYTNVLGTDRIDMINHPLNTKDQIIFGVYFLYNNRYDKLEKSSDSSECIIPIKSVKAVLRRVLDCHLSDKAISDQKIDGFKIFPDHIIIGQGDPGIPPSIKVTKVTRDDIGLIRVQGIEDDENLTKATKYKIVLRERGKKDKIFWNVLLMKPIN